MSQLSSSSDDLEEVAVTIDVMVVKVEGGGVMVECGSDSCGDPELDDDAEG